MTGPAPDERARPDRAADPDLGTGVVVGRLGRTYQLEGALRCYPEGEAEAAVVLAASRLDVEGHGLLALRFARRHGSGLVVAFQGFRTPERAQALVNALVRLDPRDAAAAQTLADAQPLRPGLPVTLDAAPFGRLEAVVPGPQPLLRVRSPQGTHLLPANAPYVRVTPDRVELVDPPEGLLDAPEPG